MRQVKIAHEAPISIFNEVQTRTDYDYCLVHLLGESEEYRRKFFKAKEEGREIYLDTSIFELGTAFEASRFAEWIKLLKPDYYFAPDALEDCNKTIAQMQSWNDEYGDIEGKKIGVVQGKTYEEIVRCYQYMDEVSGADMIAISFDYSYYNKTVPHPNKYLSWALGRAKLLSDLLNNGIINTKKDHHLLGCGLPIEFKFYQHDDFDWIRSIDTSNPVVHGIKGIQYEENFGLMSKESQKLFEMINYQAKDIDMEKVMFNIYYFRRLVNGSFVGRIF